MIDAKDLMLGDFVQYKGFNARVRAIRDNRYIDGG